MVEAATTAVAVELYREGRNALTYVTEKCDYAKDLEKNYKRLKEEAEKLYARREDVLDDASKDKTKRITKECEAWLGRVSNIEKEVQELEDEFEKGRKRPRKACRSIWSRSNLSKRIAKKCEELHSLWTEGRFETEAVVEKPPEPVRIMHAVKTENFPSLHCCVEEIVGYLSDNSIRRIGLWGTVGIGKTTIMHNLNDHEQIAEMFDIIIFATASRDSGIEKLQSTIAQRLKLRVEGISDPNEIAWRIAKELEKKRYLLLLDEVWDVLDLHAIGIQDNENESKVVLASRYNHVCSEMEADEIVNVKRLSETDAWKLFRKKAGPNITLPGVEHVARLVVRECAGLPLLIDRVARNFRRKDNINLWRDGLRSLRRWPSTKIQGMDEVLEFLRFCYDDLDDEDQKACFLYGALYPEDSDIYMDYLVECWNAEGFIKGAAGFREACDKGHTILLELINVSLFEKSEKTKHVKMNKVLRNMALKISMQMTSFKILVKASEESKKPPDPPNEKEWSGVNRISLMDNNMSSLPEAIHCDNLLTLFLQRNSELTLIPELFFSSMEKLLVLDLHGTGIKSLPPSISFLTCLRALYLNSCRHLTSLPQDVNALQSLEVLDIRRTGINSLPVQIGQLLNLKCLRISLSNSCIGTLMNCQPGVMKTSHISSLSLLEELSIDVDPQNKWWDGVVRAVIDEVATLTRLTSLSFCFPSVDYLKIFVTSNTMWKDFYFTFRFSVGYHESTWYHLDHFQYEICRCLKYANGEGVDLVISEVLAETDAFELVSHKGISSLSDFGIESINKIRFCLIEGCTDMQSIIDGYRTAEGVFQCLEKMVINNAPKMTSLWKGPVCPGSLVRLTTLDIFRCPKLMKIFSSGVIDELSVLQHLRVEECHDIAEIIMRNENRSIKSNALPSLKTFMLIDLPKLRSIWMDNSLEWPSLEGIKVDMCPSLMRLPFSNNNATKLRYIECQQQWWRKVSWGDEATEQRLESFCIFN